MQEPFALLDFIPMGAFVLDEDYTVLFWNKCMETWTGTVQQDILHKDIRELYANTGHPKLTSRLEGIFQGGPPIIFSAQLHRYIIPASLPDGRMRLQNTLVNAVRTDSGYLALFTLQDVTEISHRLEQYIAMRNHALNEVEERRKAEAEIRERETMYRSIFEKIRAVKMIIDPLNGDIVDANTAACYFYGYPYTQLMRMNILQINTMQEEQALRMMHMAVQEERNIFEFTHKLASGELREVEVHSAPIEVRGQTLLYSIIHDVTERKRAEVNLRQSESKFRLLFELAADMIVVSDAEGSILDANQMCCERLGYEKQQLFGRNILHFAPSSASELQNRLGEMQNDQPVAFETIVRSRSGESIPVEVQARRIQIEGHSAILSIGRDISERKKIESLREDVDRITRHDLKNPLGAVLGLPEVLLQAQNLDAEQRELVKVIQDAGYTMLNMVNLSLDLYKIETGSYTFTPSPVNILRLLEKILSEERDVIASKKLTTNVVQRSDNDGALDVLGEEMLCYSMLSNLVNNAVEASPMGGELTITVTTAQDENGQAEVLVSIHNQSAVPEMIRETFFNKYVTAGKDNGTGLGTYSALLMAQVQNGGITFTSSREEGTTLYVRLPRAAKNNG